MATTNRGYAVPEGTDDVNIPGDVVNLTNSIDPALTTAEIAALSWVDKPAGWKAYDTTLGKIVRSTGAAMVPLQDEPVWADWTPTITQSGAVTATVTRARWVQIGDVVHAYATLAITSSGTASNAIRIGLPLAMPAPAAAGAGGGSFSHVDTGVAVYVGCAVGVVTSTVTGFEFYKSGDSNVHGVNSGTLSNGDIFAFSVTYEAA